MNPPTSICTYSPPSPPQMLFSEAPLPTYSLSLPLSAQGHDRCYFSFLYTTLTVLPAAESSSSANTLLNLQNVSYNHHIPFLYFPLWSESSSIVHTLYSYSFLKPFQSGLLHHSAETLLARSPVTATLRNPLVESQSWSYVMYCSGTGHSWFLLPSGYIFFTWLWRHPTLSLSPTSPTACYSSISLCWFLFFSPLRHAPGLSPCSISQPTHAPLLISSSPMTLNLNTEMPMAPKFSSSEQISLLNSRLV